MTNLRAKVFGEFNEKLIFVWHTDIKMKNLLRRKIKVYFMFSVVFETVNIANKRLFMLLNMCLSIILPILC